MKILKYKQFFEELSGTELVAPIGPNYGSQELRNTIDQRSTEVLYSEITSEIYTYDDYQTLYMDYLKIPGSKPLSGFSSENLNTVLLKLQK